MINYNENNFSPNINFWENFAEDNGFVVSDNDVWDFAREYEEIPLFENIYQSILLTFISSHLKNNFNLECDIYINCRDTKCSVKFDTGYQNFDNDVLNDLLVLEV